MTELWYVLSASVTAISACVSFVTWRALDFADKLDRRERGDIGDGEPQSKEKKREIDHALKFDARARGIERDGFWVGLMMQDSYEARQYREQAEQARKRAEKL